MNLYEFQIAKKQQECNEIPVDYDLKVGIIGAGSVGQLILDSLLTIFSDKILPENIYVSTRSPEKLERYNQEYSINIFFDNNKVVEQCNIIFFCFQPTLDNYIMSELMKGFRKRNEKSKSQFNPLLVISTVSDLNKEKFEQVSQIKQIFLRTSINYKIINQNLQDFQAILKNLRQRISSGKPDQFYENFPLPLSAAKHLFSSLDAIAEIGASFNNTFFESIINNKIDQKSIEILLNLKPKVKETIFGQDVVIQADESEEDLLAKAQLCFKTVLKNQYINPMKNYACENQF